MHVLNTARQRKTRFVERAEMLLICETSSTEMD